jgi:mono/diheme cytochrome c family protein
MKMRGLHILLLCLAASSQAAYAQTNTDPTMMPAPGPATQALVNQGKTQYDRTCAQCHGRNMVSSGTSSYDLRRFPTDAPDRFFNSVTHGKNNMPSFKDALEPGAIQWLWAYVSTRGGKEM